MEPESPLQMAKLLKRRNRLRLVSSDGEEDMGQAEEALTSEQVITHCNSGQQTISPSLLSTEKDNTTSTDEEINRPGDNSSSAAVQQSAEPEQHDDHDKGVIIKMIYTDEESALDLEVDSATSTPSYKRGRCEQDWWEKQVIEAVKAEAEAFNNSKRWTRRGPSIQILTDARMDNWQQQDNMCIVENHLDWSFKRWVEALRAEIIRITCYTVIIYLEKVQSVVDVNPLKNSLQAICKVV